MKRFIASALLGLTSAFFLSAELKLGDRPPQIHFDKLLPEQTVAHASFAALEGKVVVLEMWATWCGPCIAAIPHLNELAERFKGRPIVFISVTDEEPGLVQAFLKNRPISGLVGISHTESPTTLYGVDMIPATFLIDPAGKLAGSTDPEMLSASMLEDLMAGRPLPPVELTLQPSRTTSTNSSFIGRNSVLIKGATLPNLVSSLWENHGSRMTGAVLNDPTAIYYDLSLSIPVATPANFRSWARDVVAAALHIKVTRELREMDVWVLAKTDIKPAALLDPGPVTGVRLEPGSLKLTNSTVSDIAGYLEVGLRKTILDESGIPGRYDFHLSYSQANPESAFEAMQKLGFKVEPARRKIEFMVVSRAE
jgi:uncharacterized protein (TIGR03435 family)